MLLDVSNIPPPDSTVRYAAVSWVPKVIKSERFTALALVIITATGVILGLTITGGLLVALIIPAAVIVCSSSVIGSRILIFRKDFRGREPGINHEEVAKMINNNEAEQIIDNNEAEQIIDNNEAEQIIDNNEAEQMIDNNEAEQIVNNNEEVEQIALTSTWRILIEDSPRGVELRRFSRVLQAVVDREALIERLSNNESCNVEAESSLTSPLQDEERKVLIRDLLRETEADIRLTEFRRRMKERNIDIETVSVLPFPEAKMQQFINRLLQSGVIEEVLRRIGNRKNPLNQERSGILDRELKYSEKQQVINRVAEQFRNEGGSIDLSPGINEAHLLHSLTAQGGTTFIPEGCKLDRIQVRSLVDLFEAMNTTVSCDEDSHIRPDYINPESSRVISDAGKPISYAQAKKNISTLVDQIEQRSNFSGVPADDYAREKFYTQLETFLKVIIYEIQSKNHEGALCNDIILQLVTAVENCAGRYMSVFAEGHGRLTLHTEIKSFKDIVLEEFHTIRNTIVMDITNNHIKGRGANQPHVLNRHMMNLGPLRGIRNSDNLEFSDDYDENITELQSVRAFDRIYTAQHIQQCFEEMVNGVQVMEEDGSPSDPPIFKSGNLVIGKPMAIEWLGEHVPSDWKPSIRNATGSMITLTDKQIEVLFGPGFDDEQQASVSEQSEYQQITGVERSQALRARMFRMACITTVGSGNIKSVACTYILQKLGVLQSDINWADLHMDVDVLSNVFSYDNDDLNNADIKF